jgi:mono/diheme cytochrome c family protein
MLAVYLFIALWVVVGLGLFFIAMRGRVSAGLEVGRRPQAPGARRIAGLVYLVIFVGFGVALPLLFLTGNHRNANKQVGGVTLTAGEKNGRELFGQNCGVCHTLAATNSAGKVGPNLDQIQPSASLVLHTIQNGCLQNPAPSQSNQTCLGQGTMPANILYGTQANDVAQFVARVAGKE